MVEGNGQHVAGLHHTACGINPNPIASHEPGGRQLHRGRSRTHDPRVP